MVSELNNIPRLFQTQTFPHMPFSRNHEIEGLNKLVHAVKIESKTFDGHNFNLQEFHLV